MSGIFVGRRVPDRLRVEHDQIRGASRREEPLLAQVEPPGRESGHLPDSLLEGERPLLSHVPGEDVREGAVESRVRLLGLIVKAVRGDEISFPPFRLPQSCCLRSRRLRRTRGSPSRPQAARSRARGPTLQPPTLPSRGPPPASPPRYHPPPPGIPRRAGSPYYRYGWELSATCPQLRGRSLRQQRAFHAPP